MPKAAGKLVLYIRISQEDANIGESDSIKNQRELLHRYLAEHPGLSGYEVMELSDDGFSGTNFERPGMRRLLELAQRGEIACVMVKDFSRFGRNYIETGNYLEQVFPFLGIRFISVNDGFDSAANGTLGGGLELAFKNLIHDFYSKDLSEKVKSARAVKMRKGEFTSPYAIFGYQKSPQNKNQLLIDADAAAIVRRIFTLARKGCKTTEIARILNGEKVPTPMVYKQRKNCLRSWSDVHKENFWTKDAVTRILRDARYTGKMVCKKRDRLLGQNKTVKVPQNDRIVIAGTHEAIVSESEFEEAQCCMADFREQRRTLDKTRLFYGMVKCAHCGYTMRRKECEIPYYRCATFRYGENPLCEMVSVTETALKEGLLPVLQVQSQLTLDLHRVLNSRRNSCGKQIAEKTKKQKKIRQKITSLANAKLTLYEAYHTGSLTCEQYQAQREKDAAMLHTLQEQDAALQACIEELRQAVHTGEMEKQFQSCGLIEHLAPDFIRDTVNSIYVYDENKIEIAFSFCSPFLPADTVSVSAQPTA